MDGLILSGRGSDLQKSLSFYPEIRTRHVEQKSAVFIRTSAKAFPKISPVFIRIEIRHFGELSGVLLDVIIEEELVHMETTRSKNL